MDAKNHELITREALRNAPLADDSIQLIVWANQDSDHICAGLHSMGQHFCGRDDRRKVCKSGMEFYETALRRAGDLLMLGVEDGMNLALYYLGRAFHCIQDFYAHSNWVALDKKAVWDGKSLDDRSKFCWPTPGGVMGLSLPGLAANSNWLGWRPPRNGALFHAGGPKFTMRDSWDRMQDRETKIDHPELHLDKPGAWADRVCKEHRSDRRGFVAARDVAIEHTRNLWEQFREQLRSRRRETEPPHVSMERLWRENRELDPRPRSGWDALIRLAGHSTTGKKRRRISNSYIARLRKRFQPDLGIEMHSAWKWTQYGRAV